MAGRDKVIIIFAILALLTIVVTGSCHAYLTYYSEDQDGFFWGLWHGIISFIKLPISILAPQYIHAYNINNNGFMYNLGYFIPAICELETTIPLIIVAWIIRAIFWIVVIFTTIVIGLLGR